MEKIIKMIHNDDLGTIRLNESMKFHTTMRVGGQVACLYIPNGVSSLLSVLNVVKKFKIPYIILGKGSNVIFPDTYLEVLVIKIANIFDDVIQNQGEFIIGAGVSLQKVAKNLSKMGYAGLGFAGGIPGTVGGAVYMNAGAHTHDMASIIKEVKIIDEELNIRTLTNDECHFSYRHSIFQERAYIVLEITIQLEQGDAANIFKQMAGNLEYRKAMQPLELPSCGSSFRNPNGYHAGKLIEECGLKGYMLGGAQVSEKHANFIVNVNAASSQDVIDLIAYVKQTVLEKTGIELTPEMEIIKVES